MHFFLPAIVLFFLNGVRKHMYFIIWDNTREYHMPGTYTPREQGAGGREEVRYPVVFLFMTNSSSSAVVCFVSVVTNCYVWSCCHTAVILRRLDLWRVCLSCSVCFLFEMCSCILHNYHFFLRHHYFASYTAAGCWCPRQSTAAGAWYPRQSTAVCRQHVICFILRLHFYVRTACPSFLRKYVPYTHRLSIRYVRTYE